MTLRDVTLDALAKRINDAIGNGDLLSSDFGLKMPIKLTVQTDKGYRKKAFAGGETMTIKADARVGKRNTIIFVFVCREGGDVVEMKVKEAFRNLVGFDHVMNDLFAEGFEKTHQAAQRGSRETKSVEERQIIRNKAAGYPHYGTWLAQTWSLT